MTMPAETNQTVSLTPELPPPLVHRPIFSLDKMTSAETGVREAAACIGWNDESRLSVILNCMKEEQVIFAWQLPALDSVQWKYLGAPIGLAAAVKQLALWNEFSSAATGQAATKSVDYALSSSQQCSQTQPESPSSKSLDDSLLELGFSSELQENDIFEDEQEEDEEEISVQLFPGTPTKDMVAESDPGRSVSPIISPTGNKNSKRHVVGIHGSKRRKGLSSSSPDMLGRHPNPMVGSTPNPIPYGPSPEAEARQFQSEWGEVRAVLGRLPIPDQRAFLGQLIIVANGQTQTIRAKLIENVIVRLRSVFSERMLNAGGNNTSATSASAGSTITTTSCGDDDQDFEWMIDHLREFARLRSDHRRLFGKVLFSTLSQLHHVAAATAAPNKNQHEHHRQQQQQHQGPPSSSGNTMVVSRQEVSAGGI